MKTIETLIDTELRPHVIAIDHGRYYAQPFLQQLLQQGFLTQDNLVQNAQTIEKVSYTCLTTGFCLWCQLAFSTYLKQAPQQALHQDLQQQVLSGEVFGATGLSNPMKSFNALEDFNLSHHYEGTTLVVNGKLPAVSNMGPHHYFGAISKQRDGEERVMFIIQASTEGLTLEEKSQFLGVNGSATYSVTFDNVIIPHDQIISTDAESFAAIIRPQFVALQIPIALGSIQSSLDLIDQFSNAQNGINAYLEYDVEAYQLQYQTLREQYYTLLNEKQGNLSDDLLEIIQLKKSLGYLLLDVNQASMVNGGSRAYSPIAPQVRKLKEGFFFAALTPTLRHLGKLEATFQTA
ncbi:acyl-CoA/acyl-ACP dehydrogenase [Staphylococcus lutrae]|uniref:Butyryl-CoA dehydrogenase n=1 Tax=Staphylococcus lutrae TaxID=155085 RepID=A0AAC9WJD6_9STAP|nr:acyl-CoA/acyl-ACP dehydrogenase [Staphylococcus lutrae]ARJ50746.1 butyryl-CoA dehydrogenase [Staphylococcus lutrae]PNZ37863.1 acyl-CoA dehydrogenase [Staphylococcus lutrae]